MDNIWCVEYWILSNMLRIALVSAISFLCRFYGRRWETFAGHLGMCGMVGKGDQVVMIFGLRPSSLGNCKVFVSEIGEWAVYNE